MINTCFICALNAPYSVRFSRLTSFCDKVRQYIIDDIEEYIEKKYKLDDDHTDILCNYINENNNCEFYFYEPSEKSLLCASNCFNPDNIDQLIAENIVYFDCNILFFSVTDERILIRNYYRGGFSTVFFADIFGKLNYDKKMINMIFNSEALSLLSNGSFLYN